MSSIDTDYLVVGAGAMGMAFVDMLLSDTDATVIIVDAGHQPGGHRNNTYPFVRLHQPSAYYGVNSRPLGTDSIDETGFNRGFYELATSSEITAYYEQLKSQHFLPSGRVTYVPVATYLGHNRFRTLDGSEHTVRVRRFRRRRRRTQRPAAPRRRTIALHDRGGRQDRHGHRPVAAAPRRPPNPRALDHAA